MQLLSLQMHFYIQLCLQLIHFSSCLVKKIISLQHLSVSGAVRTALLFRFIKHVDIVKSFHSIQLAPKPEQP